MNENNTIAVSERLMSRGGWEFLEENLRFCPDINSRNEVPDCRGYGFALLKSFQVPAYLEYCLCGITGYDAYMDYIFSGNSNSIERVEFLPFGYSKVVMYAKDASYNRPATVVAYYPSVARNFLEESNIPYAGISWEPGKTEALVKIGAADLGVDVMENGNTLRETGLTIIDTIMESQAVLISTKPNIKKVRKVFNTVR
ncbi:MAG: hypothetical protein HZB66_03200 [Candidatus Aenigmarchaeota archaeon]|nr:hypothetical protein [Candidatus Aenigmarchaeota archaeon]